VLEAAKAKLATAEADAKAARKLPRSPSSSKAKAGSWCDDKCIVRWDGEAAAARTRAIEAETTVRAVEAEAVTEATLKTPTWLSGVAIDLTAFASFWFASPLRCSL
jgi:hypothetical protein